MKCGPNCKCSDDDRFPVQTETGKFVIRCNKCGKEMQIEQLGISGEDQLNENRNILEE